MPSEGGDGIGLEREDFRPDEVLRLHLEPHLGGARVRRQAFASARVVAILPSVSAPAFETAMTLVRFWKS